MFVNIAYWPQTRMDTGFVSCPLWVLRPKVETCRIDFSACFCYTVIIFVMELLLMKNIFLLINIIFTIGVLFVATWSIILCSTKPGAVDLLYPMQFLYPYMTAFTISGVAGFFYSNCIIYKKKLNIILSLVQALSFLIVPLLNLLFVFFMLGFIFIYALISALLGHPISV